jgi:nucleotide-binding universal stress UspA family protein
MSTPATESRDPIVVGLDGSPQSRQALRWAADLAQLLGAPINVVTAWQYPTTYGYASPLPDWNPEADMRQVQTEAIGGVFGHETPAGLTQILEPGSPAAVLLAASETALMLVVGSRGHGGFAGLLLGSVSATVAEHASCPVLIVHGDKPPPMLPPTG